MQIKELIDSWERSAAQPRAPHSYSVNLSIHDAAKLAALAQMYPGRSEQQLLSDLVSAALDELEAQFPYEPGPRVIARDDHDDPVYEDSGLTPRFLELYEQNLERLQRQRS
jgi:hypothetical protein